MDWFYDIYTTPVPGPSCTIERIYCLDFDVFTEAHWDALGRIYDQLPGEYFVAGVPHWYGREGDPTWLWALAEPPGLQVAGLLPPAAWQEWNAAFRRLVEASSLPRRAAG